MSGASGMVWSSGHCISQIITNTKSGGDFKNFNLGVHGILKEITSGSGVLDSVIYWQDSFTFHVKNYYKLPF